MTNSPLRRIDDADLLRDVIKDIESGWSINYAVGKNGISMQKFYQWCRRSKDWDSLRALYRDKRGRKAHVQTRHNTPWGAKRDRKTHRRTDR